MRRAAASSLCAIAIGLAGCGGGGASSSTSGSSTSAVAGPRPPLAVAPGQPRPDRSAKGAKAQGQVHPKASSVPRISSAPKPGSKAPAPGVRTVKGGDNSVQEYGIEADRSDRRGAAIALQAYIGDLAEENWGAACAALASKPRGQLEAEAASATAQGVPLSGCPATMAYFKASQVGATMTITEVLSLRRGGDVAGDPSYLIFSGPPSNTLFSMPMYRESGGWKVGLPHAAELAA